MKIVNIFGIVVAVHVVVLLLIFAIPGCRTTSPSPDAEMGPMTGPAGPAPASPIQPAPAMTSADLNPPLAGAAGHGDAIPTVTSGVGPTGRYSPTRPGTPVASAVQARPVEDVTPARTYTVVRGDSLWSVAKRHGLTVRELAAANQLGTDAMLQLGQKLIIPATGDAAGSGSAASTTRGGAAAAGGTSYVIQPGDTLGAIARRHGTTVAALRAMNNLRGDLVRVGDTLLIPEAGGPSSTPPATTSTPAAPASAPNVARGGGGTMKHVVAPGETLGAIARRYGVKLGDLALANNIADPARIRPGQELMIPGWQSAGNAGASAPKQVPTQYPPSFEPAPAPAEPPTIATEPATEDVPVIQVEEPVPTLSLEPAPDSAGGGGGGDSEPPLFN